MLGYARQQLIQRIKTERNIEVDPDSIFISTTEALQTGAVIYPFGGSGFPAGVSIERTGPSITHKTTVRSLSELALANVGDAEVQIDPLTLSGFARDAYDLVHDAELDLDEGLTLPPHGFVWVRVTPL